MHTYIYSRAHKTPLVLGRHPNNNLSVDQWEWELKANGEV